METIVIVNGKEYVKFTRDIAISQQGKEIAGLMDKAIEDYDGIELSTITRTRLLFFVYVRAVFLIPADKAVEVSKLLNSKDDN